VLRSFVTGTWGEDFGTSPMLPGDTLHANYVASWNSNWVKANSKIVFYVYNPDNYHILQVIAVSID
jgi:hypothetical protein